MHSSGCWRLRLMLIPYNTGDLRSEVPESYRRHKNNVASHQSTTGPLIQCRRRRPHKRRVDVEVKRRNPESLPTPRVFADSHSLQETKAASPVQVLRLRVQAHLPHDDNGSAPQRNTGEGFW